MRSNSQYQMIIWTFIAVVLVGFGVLASVLQPPQTMQFKAPIAETKIELSERSPASINDAEFKATSIDDKGTQAVDFTLPCEGNGRFSKNVVQIRLSGTLCLDTHAKQKRKPSSRSVEPEFESTEIRNTTNGFSATVFYTGAKQTAFTTDYITLAPGENQIAIRHILKSGARLDRDFKIERQ